MSLRINLQMKILHITSYPEIGETFNEGMSGVAWYAKNLIGYTPYTSNDRIYIICNKLNNKNENYKESKAEIIRCFNRNWRFVFQIIPQVLKIRPDLIHLQHEVGLFGGIITAFLFSVLLLFFKLIGIKTIVTLHGVVSWKKIDSKFVEENRYKMPVFIAKTGLFFVFKPIIVLANLIIVHEEYFKEILFHDYYCSENKIIVNHLGVEDLTKKIVPNAKKKIGYLEKTKTVLFMGYYTGYKGLGVLIDAFAKFCKHEKNSMLIVGSGLHPRLKNDKEYLESYYNLKKSAIKRIGKNLDWVGFIDEKKVPLYYSAADIVVMPYTVSMSSSGPMAIAMGFERPFIASDAFSQVFGSNAILFQNTTEKLSKKLSDFFIKDRKVIEKIGLELKNKRIWSVIGRNTYVAYKNL